MFETLKFVQFGSTLGLVLRELWSIAVAVEIKTKGFASVGGLNGVVVYYDWFFWAFE